EVFGWDEFNKFYMRGLCLRVLAHPECEAIITRRQDFKRVSRFFAGKDRTESRSAAVPESIAQLSEDKSVRRILWTYTARSYPKDTPVKVMERHGPTPGPPQLSKDAYGTIRRCVELHGAENKLRSWRQERSASPPA